MPIYEYSCGDCGKRFEILQSLGAGAEGVACPECGGEHLDKEYSTFAGAVSGGAAGGFQPGSGGCCRGTPT